MHRRAQQFMAAFLLGILFIAGLCGFALVDLRSGQSMPDQHGELLQISKEGDTLQLSVFGQDYRFESQPAIQESLWAWRGLFPRSATLTATLVTRVRQALMDYAEQQGEP